MQRQLISCSLGGVAVYQFNKINVRPSFLLLEEPSSSCLVREAAAVFLRPRSGVGAARQWNPPWASKDCAVADICAAGVE
jgi:hypothetical protein